MSFSFRYSLGLVSLILAGCRSASPPEGSGTVERLAVLPFDNLSGDRSLDWIGRGAQVVLNRQLSVSRTVAASVYGTPADAMLGRATRILHGTFQRRAGDLLLGAYLEDGVTHLPAGERLELRVPPEQLLIGLNQLAKQLASDASAPPASQPEAVQAFIAAQTAPQADLKAQALQRSAQLDPQFGLPLVALAELNIGTNQPDQARLALEAAGTRNLDPLERQQVNLLQANLAHNRAAQIQALTQMAEAAPSQPQVQVLAATLLMRLRQFLPAVAAYERALRVDPDNADLWNRLGYVNGYLGRLPGARRALEAYQKLQPSEPNPLVSLGEIHYAAADFKSAADYFHAAYGKAPQFEGGRPMLKEAYARLMSGQMDAARQALAVYLKSAGPQPAAVVGRANFLYASGEPDAAFKSLADAAASATGPLASLYQTHRCGLLVFRHRAEAAEAARAAMAAAASPLAVLCSFISQPSATPEEWSARVERAFPGPQGQAFRREALAYALFFDRHYPEAYPLLESLALERNPDSDSEIRVLLAECQWRTGRWSSARETLARWPLPDPNSIFGGHLIPSFLLSTLKVGERYEDKTLLKRLPSTAETIFHAVD